MTNTHSDPDARGLNRARAVQLGMLPDPPVLEGFQFRVHYSPCEEVGGDFYDFISVSPSELGIVVADVSGHGLDAALLMAAAKKSLQIHARGRSSPAETLGIVCRDLATEIPKSSFITVFYGIIDLGAATLKFASAGHNPPLILHDGELQEVSAKGMVISGMLSKMFDGAIEEKSVALQDGMSIVLHTDGITEAKNAAEQEFGEGELNRVLRASSALPPDELCDSVIEAVRSFSNDAPQEDDMTMLVIRCADLGTASIGKTETIRGLRWSSNISLATRKLVGREAMVQEILAALTDQPVINLVGPGGIGKTALATEVGREALEVFPGGSWLIDCTGAENVEQAAEIIAETLRIDVPGGTPYSKALPASLAHRKRTLLILDDVGGIDAWKDYVQVLQRAAPTLRVIQTAHSRSGCGEARTFVVPPLQAPPRRGKMTRDELMEFDSVRCFIERIESNNPAVALSDEDLRSVAGICRELEGVPQALELAAGAADVVSLSGIYRAVKSQSHKLTALDSAGVDTESLRRAVQLTHSQLDEGTRKALGILSLTRGGFTLEAAQAVLGGRVRSPVDVIGKLLRSGVASKTATPYGARFQINALVANTARDAWKQSTPREEQREIRTQMVGYFADTADRLCVTLSNYWGSRPGIEAIEQLELDSRNIYASLRIAIREPMPVAASQLALAIVSAHSYRGDMRRGSEILESALDCVGTDFPEQRAKLLEARATVAFSNSAPHEAVIALCEEALELEKQHDFQEPLVGALKTLSSVYAYRSEIEKCDRCIEQVMQRLLALNVPGRSAEAYAHKGLMLRLTHRGKEALEHLEKVEEVDPAHNNHYALMMELVASCSIHASLGHDKKAIELCSRAVQVARATQSRGYMAFVTHRVAGLYVELGQPDKSLEKYARAEELYAAQGAMIGLISVWQGYATALLTLDDAAGARPMALRALEASRETGYAFGVGVAATLTALCEFELENYAAARERIAEAIRVYEEAGNEFGSVRGRTIDACLLWLTGKKEEGFEAMEEVQATARRLNEPPRSLLLLIATARALTAIGASDDAQVKSLAQRAEQVYERYREKRYVLSAVSFLAEKLLERVRRDVRGG